MKGIDVSSHQGKIDWSRVKNDGVEFAIIKVIRKDLTPDKMFEYNYAGCEKNGVLIQGVYNYSYATTVEKAKLDAHRVVEVLGNRKPMVWLDVEDKCQQGIGTRLYDIIVAYRNIITSNGLKFGVYTGLSFYNSFIKPFASQLKDIPFWIARYPSKQDISLRTPINILKKPSISNMLYGWQYSSTCRVEGINAYVDANDWYVKTEQNNTKPVSVHTTLKYGDSGSEVKKMQELLIKNRFKTALILSNGKEVRKKLVADGKFGQITKSVLTRYQGYVGLPQTGICDTTTWEKLEGK